MKTSTVEGKRIVIVTDSGFSRTVGFEINDYVTLALGVKKLYEAGFAAAIVGFDGELFACEGNTITPIGEIELADKLGFDEWDGVSSFAEYCLNAIKRVGESKFERK